MKARSFILLPIAIGSLSFTASNTDKPGKVEMRISFPFLQKKFTACKDSSLTARVVIYNRTDTIISFSKKETESKLAFEITTTTTKFTVEKKDASEDDKISVLFPGDSLVMYSLLVSSTCQLTNYSRRIPKPKQGLKSVRVVLITNGDDSEESSYEGTEATEPVTAPDHKAIRNAVRRSDGNVPEVSRSLFRGSLASNVFHF